MCFSKRVSPAFLLYLERDLAGDQGINESMPLQATIILQAYCSSVSVLADDARLSFTFFALSFDG